MNENELLTAANIIQLPMHPTKLSSIVFSFLNNPVFLVLAWKVFKIFSFLVTKSLAIIESSTESFSTARLIKDDFHTIFSGKLIFEFFIVFVFLRFYANENRFLSLKGDFLVKDEL